MLGGFNPFDLGNLAPGGAKTKTVAKPAKTASKPATEPAAAEESVHEEEEPEIVRSQQSKSKSTKSRDIKTAKMAKTATKGAARSAKRAIKPAHKTSKSTAVEDAEKEYQRKMRQAFEAQFGQVDGVGASEEDGEAGESENESENESGSDVNNEEFDDDEDLEELSKTYVEQPSDDDMGSSSDEEDAAESADEGPVVVKFLGSDRSTRDMRAKAEKKSFMNSKTPLSELQKEEKEKNEKKPRQPQTKEEEEEEKEDLQNDVALQRLITESSILHEQAAKSQFSGADISFLDDGPIGRARLRTLETRIENLGGRKIPHQKNMPMLTRRFVKARFDKKVKDEQDHAKEAGIILAKTAPVDDRWAVRKKKTVKRDRGLKINSVGKSTAGGIFISNSDIKKYGGKR